MSIPYYTQKKENPIQQSCGIEIYVHVHLTCTKPSNKRWTVSIYKIVKFPSVLVANESNFHLLWSVQRKSSANFYIL